MLAGLSYTCPKGKNVRPFVLLAAVGSALECLMPSSAESFTYGNLVAGQVKTALASTGGSAWCFVGSGSTDFQINQAGSKAVMSFAELTYFDGATYYGLNGQSILNFASATGGILHFKQRPDLPDSVHNPAFTNYTETYTAPTDQVIVTFSIVFPACTLPIYAVYDAP
jgi:hypothetical protein